MPRKKCKSRTYIAGALIMLACFCSTGRAEEPEYAWIEAESPAHADFTPKIDGHNLYSGGKRLSLGIRKNAVKSKMPANGFNLNYKFKVVNAGTYILWMRVGYESIRSPLDWRIDKNEWQTLQPDVPETGLIETWTWNGQGWCMTGKVQLAAGAHDLALRITGPGRDGRILASLDCFALVRSRWKPELILKPGQTYNQDIDRKAAAQVFSLPAPADDTARPARPGIELSGLWQVARYYDIEMDRSPYEPVRSLPADDPMELRWMGIEVPGDGKKKRPELKFANRLLYRTKVKIPSAYQGHGFLLHFSGTCWIASVFVNGQYCGARKSVLVPWDCDVSRAVKPGATNEIVIAIKTFRYAFDPRGNKGGQSLQSMANAPSAIFRRLKFIDAIYPSSKGEGPGTAVGIVFPVRLDVTGPVRTDDVWIRTSVKLKEIKLELQIANTTNRARQLQVKCEAVNLRTGKTEKTLQSSEPVTVPPHGRPPLTLRLKSEWKNPGLWWPQPNANLYCLRTTLMEGDRVIDTRSDTFGFRETSWQGRDYCLNGIPWHFWCWVAVKRSQTDAQWLREYHTHNNRFHRISHDSDKRFGSREKALAFFDSNGIPGRLSTCIDGMFITHNLDNPLVWKNFQEHVRQVVKAYRNHPSVMQWSLGNEMVLIAGRLRFRKIYDKVEKEAAELSRIAAQLDPTRLSYQDGGGDLGGRIPINCQHYTWIRGSGFPQKAYQYNIGPAFKPRGKGSFQQIYLWNGKTPLVLGEVFYHAGDVGKMAWFGGPAVYRGKTQADIAAGRYVRIAIEGARWQNVTGICPWVGPLPGADKSFAARAVFVREHDRCFFSGSELSRTIGIFNDGHATDPLTLKWRIMVEGREIAKGDKTYDIDPGRHQEDRISARLPTVTKRSRGQLILHLTAEGKPVFSDTKAFSIMPQPPAPSIKPGLAVFDPSNSVIPWLQTKKVGFVRLENLNDIKETVTILLLGKNAITKAIRKQAANTVTAMSRTGRTVIILDQAMPLAGRELPVPAIKVFKKKSKHASWEEFKAAQGGGSAIVHPISGSHPVLRGLEAGDFFTWDRQGSNIYRFPHTTPESGVIPILESGPQLGQCPLFEILVGDGSCLVSQMLITNHLGKHPAADRLLYNILNWANARSSSKPIKTMVFSGKDRRFKTYLDGLGLKYDSAPTVNEIFSQKAGLAVIRGRADAVRWLADNQQAVRDACAGGRWIMLCNLEQSGLSDFNRLVGFRHRMRRGMTEKVILMQHDDPLLMGISDRDMLQYSNRMIASWMHLYRVSSRVFFNVVDGADIASFGKCRYRKIANGLTNDDFWHYIQYIKGKGETIDIIFDRAETLTRFSIWSNPSYYFIRNMDLVFDGNQAQAIHLTLKAEKGRQTFVLQPPRKAAKVSLVIKTHWPRPDSKQDLMGIDNIELIRELPKGANTTIVPLTKPGGLMAYKIGKGGIVLNQVDYLETVGSARIRDRRKRRAMAQIAANVKKKRNIYYSLLRNLGARFRFIQPQPAKGKAASGGKHGTGRSKRGSKRRGKRK